MTKLSLNYPRKGITLGKDILFLLHFLLDRDLARTA